MRFTSRSYTDERDWERMVAMLVDAWGLGGRDSVEGLGDWAWWTRVAGWQDAVRLWEDPRGRLVGFISQPRPTYLEMNLHPDHRDGALPEQMLAWGEQQCRNGAASGSQKAELRLYASEGDAVRIGLLERAGYARRDLYHYGLFRSLDGAIGDPSLPEGFRLRGLSGEREAAPRATAHTRVFGSVTADTYLQVMRLPQYRPDLDVVAMAPDGSLAAFCLCWLDATNRIGQFEPVGTRPEFRQQGLGRAVCLEGLRRLAQHGARTAYVCCDARNDAALRLYESCAFRILRRDFNYSRTL
jgi:ribosomal protein S18 acetylase RimI-like enzyme